MWPYIIKEPIPIGTYGVMMAIGFLTAYWLLSRELRRRNIPVKIAETTIFLGIVMGVIGAKLAYMFTEAESVSFKDFFSGSGLTWHGGLILAATVIIVYYVVKGLPLLVMLDAVAPTLATGYAFGRMGCQLAGDGDYGIACSSTDFDFPVCMSYPRGIVPTTEDVHPTPVYEFINNFLLFGVLWSLRKHIRRPGLLFALYLIGSGLLRFGIEFIRQAEGRPERFWGLRDAHLVALFQVVLGIGLGIYALVRRVPQTQAFGVLPVPVEEPSEARAGRKGSRRRKGG